jgi:phosphinothricin acetyltransferase
MNISIEPMTALHWPEVRAIYLEGIATGNATFEVDAPTWESWDRAHHAHSRLVACVDDAVAGWAALSPVSARRVYAGVAEASLYVATSLRGRGVGKALMQVLVTASEREGIWTLQAGVFPENAASLALIHGFGFRQVGTRERIGQRDGVWRDVLLLERRSTVVGV